MRPRTLALALTAGAAGGVGIALAHLKRPGGAAPQSRPLEEYRCDCGERFRFTGTGRHRVYWRHDAGESDPVLSPQCPSCERPLPGTRATEKAL
jgi:hypothetical protein